jgi:MoaA/NifB/PqqE/SkfB family radical SAM enzyme
LNMGFKKVIQKNPVRFLLRSIIKNNYFRPVFFALVISIIRKAQVRNNPEGYPVQIKEDKLDMVEGLFKRIDKNTRKKNISKKWIDSFLQLILKNSFSYQEGRAATIDRIGIESPFFLAISPGNKCNLNCDFCSSNSRSEDDCRLTFEIFDKILTDKMKLWGSYFTVVSGGEPFLWHERGKDLIDLADLHSSQLFFVYTNGTLLDSERVKRIANAGNIIPAVSLEGFEGRTDFHRGKGTFNKILQSFKNLREAGIPFAVSITIMKDNYQEVASDAFMDFCFEEQCATLGFIFHYLPIGRGEAIKNSLSSQQRYDILEWVWGTIRKRKLFLLDFLNCRTATSGCFAAGRPDGYLHINWNGDVSPCIFVPYTDTNIKSLYKKNYTLDNILLTDFMTKIREWQVSYGYRNPESKTNNWYAPCLIRDHNNTFARIVNECGANPVDSNAAKFMADNEIRNSLVKASEKYKKVTNRRYKEKYLNMNTITGK